MTPEHETLYWIWLSLRCPPACRKFPELLKLFGSPFEIYRADEEVLEQVKDLDDRLRNALCNKELEEAYRILEFCAKQGIRVLPYGDAAYPARLRNLQDPPILLYCRGVLPDFDRRLCIAVVGTRRMSEYGKRSAYKISYELAGTGTVVVSGMALGIDSAAACGALEAGGTTVAVIGSGIDVVYPREHRKLCELIAANGAVISE
jgi:DNA processing protein